MRGLIGDRDLLGARIGSDLRYMLFDLCRRFSAVAPQAHWVDFTDDVYALRRVKHPSEVERLRRATGSTRKRACASRSKICVSALLGPDGRVGSLQLGRRADLLAVAGDPLQDLRYLEGVLLVLRGGAEVAGGPS